MKFLSLSLLILGIGGAIASPFPAADDESVNYEGFPTDDVTCPDEGTSKGDKFSADYMKKDIGAFLNDKKKKYPAPFGTGHESADSFNFQNDCRKRADDGETILELPMFTDDKTWGDVGSKPGPYRVYYIQKEEDDKTTVTYCAAYAHLSKKDLGSFKACS